jgi:hypothetical protein
MCKCVLPPGVNPTAVDKYINIDICITNQAYKYITKIIFQIQKMLALLPETPATNKTIQTTAQTVDCDGNTGDLATQQ